MTLLPLISELNPDSPVAMIGSPIARICKTETLKNSIDIMLKKNIRNLVISPSNDGNNEENYLLNDRKILQFIFSYDGRKIVDRELGANALSSVSVNYLDMTSVSSNSGEQSIGETAAMLKDISTPGLLFKKNYIVTPWDVVMKTIGKENLSYV